MKINNNSIINYFLVFIKNPLGNFNKNFMPRSNIFIPNYLHPLNTTPLHCNFIHFRVNNYTILHYGIFRVKYSIKTAYNNILYTMCILCKIQFIILVQHTYICFCIFRFFLLYSCIIIQVSWLQVQCVSRHETAADTLHQETRMFFINIQNKPNT